jgi:hypothetical protein
MKILFSLVFVFCCTVIVQAQEHVIDKAEFDAIVAQGNTHKLKWSGEKYRMTVTTSSKTIGRPQTDYSSKMVFEFGPPTDVRTITTSMFGANPAKVWQSMRIGDLVYTRSGDDPWRRKEYAPPVPSKESAESPYKVVTSQAEYKYIGQGTVTDTPVQGFVKTERATKVNQTTGENAESESKIIYWIDAKGLIRKSEYTSEHRGKFTSQTSVIMEWQLDPSIAFTAPEIVP